MISRIWQHMKHNSVKNFSEAIKQMNAGQVLYSVTSLLNYTHFKIIAGPFCTIHKMFLATLLKCVEKYLQCVELTRQHQNTSKVKPATTIHDTCHEELAAFNSFGNDKLMGLDNPTDIILNLIQYNC